VAQAQHGQSLMPLDHAGEQLCPPGLNSTFLRTGIGCASKIFVSTGILGAERGTSALAF
jgi:hypothetical protein